MRSPSVVFVFVVLFALLAVRLRADDGAGTWEYPDRPQLAVRGEALVLEEGGRTTVLVPTVPPAVARSGAAVRRAHEVVASRDGRFAVALLTIGRQDVAVPVRREGAGPLEFAAPIPVPLATRVLLSPRDDAFLLVSERDLVRPPGADRPGWNRGAVYVRFGELAFLRELEVTTVSEARLWYEAPVLGARYRAPQDFVLRAVRWLADGCLLHLDLVTDGPRSVRLRPRGEWESAGARCPEVRRLLATERAELWPVGGGRFLALTDDGPHAAEVVLVAATPELRIVAAVRVHERIDDLLCPAFAGEAALERDGAPQVVFYDWTGIGSHRNAWLVRVSGDRLVLSGGPIFIDLDPIVRYDPESGEERLELVRLWWPPLRPDSPEVATSWAWREEKLVPVAEERQIDVEAAAHLWTRRSLPPGDRLRVWSFLAGRPFADLPAARAWWAEHAEPHRRGDRYVFRAD